MGELHGAPQNYRYLIVVHDLCSKWPEVCPTSQIGTEQIVGFLEDLFARWRFSSTIGTDNGPQFSSGQFETFLQAKGIRHVRTAYYHSQFNGGVERFNQVLKQGFRAYLSENVSFPEALRKILMNYRATPHALTRMSPAELMIRRQLRSPLHHGSSTTVRRL